MKSVCQVKVSSKYLVECFKPDGSLRWKEEVENLVVNQGLDYLHDVALLAATQITAWFVGLTGATPVFAAANTLASHAGWTEVTAYTGNRKSWVGVDSGTGSGTNAASKASFAINAGSTVIGGAFLASVSSGSSGTLYGGAAFAANRTAESGDTVNVTVATSVTAS